MSVAEGALIGVDIGTTRVKAVAFALDGSMLGSAERPTPWRVVAVPGASGQSGTEIDADLLADLVRTVTVEVAAGLPGVTGPPGVTGSSVPTEAVAGPAVAGVGVTGMGEAGALTGSRGEVFGPIRAWHDPRGDIATIRAAVGELQFTATIGMPLTAQTSLAKILQLRDDDPGSRAATRFWSVPEWGARALGGDPGSELSLAGRTGLLDLATGAAWPGAIDLLGRDLLGEPQPAGTPVGRVAAGLGVAALTGAVLVVAGHDHPCAALAAGGVRPGTLFNSLGTAEALLRFTDRLPAPGAVAELVAAGVTVGHTVRAGHYCLLAGRYTGMAWERVTGLLGATDRESRRQLTEAALPLLDGDPDGAGIEITAVAGGAVVTVLREASRPQVWAAAVRQLVAASQPLLDRINAVAGPHDRVLASGGWLQDAAVRQQKQRQLPGLRPTAVAEAGAAGAAYLAGVAAGVLDPERTPWQD